MKTLNRNKNKKNMRGGSRNTKRRNIKTKRNQKGGELVTATILIGMGVSMVSSLLIKLIIGTINIYWAKMYPNEIIEQNNKIISGNYVSAINFKKQNIKLLQECIEDRKNSLYYIKKDKTKSKEDIDKIEMIFLQQIKEYENRISDDMKLLKEDSENYGKFQDEQIRKLEDINKRLRLMTENANIQEIIQNESKESGFSKWLNKSSHTKDLDKKFKVIKGIDPKKIELFSKNIGIDKELIDSIEEKNFKNKKNIPRQEIFALESVEELEKMKQINILTFIDLLTDKDSIINLDITNDDVSNILSNVKDTEIHSKLIELCINKNIEKINSN
jgi:hypothetical protein